MLVYLFLANTAKPFSALSARGRDVHWEEERMDLQYSFFGPVGKR